MKGEKCLKKLLLTILLLIGVISYNSFSMSEKELEAKKIKIRQDFLKKRRIHSFYKNWKNTKYKWGGQTKDGVDCSALMQNLYKERFAKRLTRTTLTQINEGKKIDKRKDWRVGDLIFFRTGKNTRHVGVYLGGNKFMHSGTSSGVTISEFDEYWKKRYWQTRRVM